MAGNAELGLQGALRIEGRAEIIVGRVLHHLKVHTPKAELSNRRLAVGMTAYVLLPLTR